VTSSTIANRERGAFLDTNILLYSISTDPREATKRTIALALLDRPDWCLSVQVLQEFYVQAIRPTGRVHLDHEAARDLVLGWQRFHIQDLTVAVLNDALAIKGAHQLSYWDSAIIAAARACGCDEVVTEDLQHNQRIAGLRIVNPFR